MSNGSLDADVTDETARGMITALEPAWVVTSVERVERGTDFVAVPEVVTPGDACVRRVVLTATTAGLVSATGSAERDRREADHRAFVARYL